MATKRKKNPQKGGRPSKFTTAMLRQVTQLCRLGATDEQLTEFLEIVPSTLYEWKKRPEFSEAIKRGKLLADAQVADALYHRAIGYQQKTVKIFQHKGKPVIVKVVEKFAPDTTACIIWLKNRDKVNWRDKVEVEDVTDWGAALAAGEERIKTMKQPLIDAIKTPAVH